ncbi:2OG-Fe(II) oxygenase [Spongiibacter sp. KMU-158]|uniref:2OG-Fe(II) oxygenase n=1 Tax=Spongiibacter pelagi TaxID=2760804 RepID=A0A927GWN9_9GAMM|nr:2OG-Fe(II) oxygenase [Spongiibacter pelagi]MBD2859951.1 2OG-Fe(II) oxygenase [Spongiibacter pelagi]
MSAILNLQAIKDAPLQLDPYPFFTLDRSINSEKVDNIINAFPALPDGGSYNLEDTESAPAFEEFTRAIDSVEFRQLLCEKFDVDVMNLPMMMTLRGHSRAKDGRIHSDSKTKVLTILIYLNHDWNADTGRLRVLRSQTDMEDYVTEIEPGPGSLLAFKVTDNGWHGYPSFVGPRQSIQINFLTGEGANKKHRFFHGISAKLKKLRRRL